MDYTMNMPAMAISASAYPREALSFDPSSSSMRELSEFEIDWGD